MRPIHLIACLLIAGCGYKHPPDKMIEKSAEKCEDFGYVIGGSGHASCVQQLAAKSSAEADRRLARELAR